MKEFIEKLIGRLEVNSFPLTFNFETEIYLKYNKVKEIVNQLAEEYAKDIDVPTIDVSELFGKTEQGNDGWIPCSERLPEDDTKGYIVQKTNGFIDILGFSKDAYRLSRYDFYEYKGKKKAIFFDYDSEYGYCEWECEAWQPLPAPYEPKGEK